MPANPLTAHQLARLLLAGPDEPVAYPDNDGLEVRPILRVWRGVQTDPDSTDIMFPQNAAHDAETQAYVASAPRVVLLTAGLDCPVCDETPGRRGVVVHDARCPVTRAELPADLDGIIPHTMRMAECGTDWRKSTQDAVETEQCAEVPDVE